MAGQSFDSTDAQYATGPMLNYTLNYYCKKKKRMNLSRDSLDSEISSVEFFGRTLHVPPTPNNQPMELTPTEKHNISQKTLEQYISSSIITGGFNSETRGHFMEKIIESEANLPEMAGAKGSSCAIPGCDGKFISNPCECGFKICRDCFIDAVKGSDRICLGCKEPYENVEDVLDRPTNARMPKMEPKLSVLKSKNGCSKKRSQNSGLERTQSGVDFDGNRWLLETNGTYIYGNAMWLKDGGLNESNENDGSGILQELLSKPCRPLTRKLKIATGVISPYRLLILIRMIVLGLFLHRRITHPNEDAIWLWMMSIICEFWFALSWLLDQLPKLFHVNRATDLNVLKEKLETEDPTNPTGKSDLPRIDIFVSTADPEKEPPLVTANTILSILLPEYPVEKLACYISDDSGALLSFEALAESASFAKLWVPFFRKHDIEPRNPETYFGLKNDSFKNKIRQDFVKDRRMLKHEYDEFKVRINSLPDSIRRRSYAYNAKEEINSLKHRRHNIEDGETEPLKVSKATWMTDGAHWPGTWVVSGPEHSRGDHAGILQVVILKAPSGEILKGTLNSSPPFDFTEVDISLPMLVYVSREKRPGYDHNKKAGAMNALVRASAVMSNGPFILNLDCDHYIYNSEAMREGMCFMTDRGGDRIAFVQFPQRFEGIDPSGLYANHNTVFFDVNMRASRASLCRHGMFVSQDCSLWF